MVVDIDVSQLDVEEGHQKYNFFLSETISFAFGVKRSNEGTRRGCLVQ